MATSSGPSDLDVARSAVEERLRNEPYLFEFFQAVRLLGRFLPDKVGVGKFALPSAEVARFQANSALGFPASEIQALTWSAKGPVQMRVNFMGLTGPQGVLPLNYTVYLAERARAGDSAAVDFFDIFNHRIISLFFQAWEKYRFWIAYEHGDRDQFSHHLLDLIGLGTPGLQDRQAVPDDSLLYYSGLLAQHPRSAVGLEQILSDYFEVPVEVEQFAGGWYRLDTKTQCCLEGRGSYSEQLGVGAVVGDEVWDQTARVRLKIGPLSLAQYKEFLPTGSAFEPLRVLTHFFSNGEFDFEVQLILNRHEVPPCELGADAESAPRLGWTTWGRTTEMTRDVADTVLQLWEGNAHGAKPKIVDRKAE
jgi:type VI secretion system protein ImpH